MKSTSTSDVILKVENLNLVYHMSLRKNLTWRDAFTSFSKDPVGTIRPARERLQVLKDVNIEIRRGERVGLIGVNGAGKTSFCRCIAGMYHPTSGKIELRAPLRAIFDTSVGIQPELTGRENAELLANFLFPAGEDVDAIIDEALEFSELGKFADVPYKLYSNGMQARLYLSLVSARGAGFLILDEVFDGADVFFREKISKRVMAMIEQSGAALFVSHSFEQVKKVCQRVLILNQSQITFDGPPEEAVKAFDGLRPAANV